MRLHLLSSSGWIGTAAASSALVLTGLTAPVALATTACAGTPLLGVTFTCTTPGVSNIPVPNGATSVQVTVIGGGGGGGSFDGRGGHGAEVSARLVTSGIQELLVTVASGGQGSIRNAGSDPGPGAGGTSGGGTAGEFGSYGSAADSISRSSEMLSDWDRWPTGGGMSAIANGTGKSAGSPMAVDDLLVIAGGGGGAAISQARNGGDGASNIGGAGGNGAPADTADDKSARGGSAGVGGAGAIGSVAENGSAGASFNGTSWGAGGAGAFGSYSTGGAGYGGGGGAIAASSFSAAAGGSFARSTALIGVATSTPATNGGIAASAGGNGGTGGNGSVSLTFFAPPTVVTAGATSVTTSTATIDAIVNANGSETSAMTIKYSTDETTVNAGSGTAVAVTPAGASGASDVNITANLSGLEPDTEYFYRVSASNSEGTSAGSVLFFRTVAPTPTPTPTPTQPPSNPANNSGGNSQTLPPNQASPQGGSALTESPLTTATELIPSANPAQSRVIAQGIEIVGAQTARLATSRVMQKGPSERLGKAPVVRSRTDQPTKLIVQKGLESNTQYKILIKGRGQKYNKLGVVETDSAGAVQLPVFAVRNPNLFIIAISHADRTLYLKVKTRR